MIRRRRSWMRSRAEPLALCNLKKEGGRVEISNHAGGPDWGVRIIWFHNGLAGPSQYSCKRRRGRFTFRETRHGSIDKAMVREPRFRASVVPCRAIADSLLQLEKYQSATCLHAAANDNKVFRRYDETGGLLRIFLHRQRNKI